MAEQRPDARGVAIGLMTEVTLDKRQLLALTGSDAVKDPAVRARAQRLATEALRWANRSDRLLGPFLRNKPDDFTLNALRLAIYETRVAGAPVPAVVHSVVGLVPENKRGLVNAVLRNVERRGTTWSDLPPPALPKWLRKPLTKAWGKEAVAAMELVFAQTPPIDITVKSDPKNWAERLGGTLLPTGSIRLTEFGQVSKLEGFETGDWWVQDAGAALAAKVLDVEPNERVLDLCAAPGGKTLQMASAGGKVTALDVSAQRLQRLKDNLARTNLSAEVVEADALKWEPSSAFDAILLDAPCSASGTLRRHPDLAYAKDGTELETLISLQEAMLGCAWNWLKPGGRMVYCTCSLFPSEGEEQITAFLNKHADASISQTLPADIPKAWVDERHCVRIRPDFWADEGGIDGFFVASLQKSG
ncbi:MAG: methyltransferase domain-containing protein [Boseongicola sp.]|nr:methyltransferase domain-containing protein [Boseongicola sp.]MDD9976676.1 methyltransferase domain-containing protein [Boseongicola sp.]